MGQQGRSDGEVRRVHSGYTGATGACLRETGHLGWCQSDIAKVDCLGQERCLLSNVTGENSLNLSISGWTGWKPARRWSRACPDCGYAREVC